MAPLEEMHTAMVNRSIRTIKAELEYLTDAQVITPQTLSELLQRMPQQTVLHAPLSVGAIPTSQSQAGTIQPPPTSAMGNMNLQNNGYGQAQQQQQQHSGHGQAQPQRQQNSGYGQNNGYQASRANDEKRDNSYYQHQPPPAAATPQAQPPPAYNAPPGPPPQANYPPLAHATALYPYNSNDAGDLALQPNDRITVTEYMNAEWWKGRSDRTGQEGIFPRSYVKVEEKAPPAANLGNNYGNEPLAVSGMGNGEEKAPSKIEENGKKFGKKLGNATIFGAGATIGGNLVNSIF